MERPRGPLQPPARVSRAGLASCCNDGPALTPTRLSHRHAVNQDPQRTHRQSKAMAGFDAPIVPGGLGLPRHSDRVRSRKARKNLLPGEPIACVRAYRHRRSPKQKPTSAPRRPRAMGPPYLTLASGNEAAEIRFLRSACLQRATSSASVSGETGASRLPFWSWPSAEVEYEDPSRILSVDVGFLVRRREQLATASSDCASCRTRRADRLWTTTGRLGRLPGNQALNVHPDFYYVLLLKRNRGPAIVADAMLSAVGLPEHRIRNSLARHA